MRICRFVEVKAFFEKKFFEIFLREIGSGEVSISSCGYESESVEIFVRAKGKIFFLGGKLNGEKNANSNSNEVKVLKILWKRKLFLGGKKRVKIFLFVLDGEK